MLTLACQHLSALQEQWMDKTAMVSRTSGTTQNALGERVPTITTFSLPCRVNVADSADVQAYASMTQSTQAWTVEYPTRFTLRTSDTLAIEAQLLVVLGVIEAQSFETVHRAICKATR